MSDIVVRWVLIPTSVKILTIVISVAPHGSWFFPYSGGVSWKFWCHYYSFCSCWLIVLLFFAFIAFIKANIISVAGLFPTICIRAQLIHKNVFLQPIQYSVTKNIWSKVQGKKNQWWQWFLNVTEKDEVFTHTTWFAQGIRRQIQKAWIHETQGLGRMNEKSASASSCTKLMMWLITSSIKLVHVKFGQS